jgi:hypothetical protein
MRLPYRVTLRPVDDEVFTVTVAATDTEDARKWIHSIYDASVLSITAQPVHSFRVVEHDVQFNLDSVIYSSDNELDATRMLEHLRAAWLSGERYTFSLQHG